MPFNPIWFLIIAIVFYLGYDLFYRLGMVKQVKQINETLEDIFNYQREILNELKKK